jgi:hypothetical protein
MTDGAPALSKDEFVTYFTGRPNYAMDGAHAWYSNEDTGVYFSFDHDPQIEPPEDWADVAEPDEIFRPTIASFTINLNRPSFFGVEAAGELEAFSRRFALIVHDDQIDGHVSGSFSSEQFIGSWSATNRWACSAVRETSEEKVLTYSGLLLQKTWRWNFQRKATQDAVGEQVFVPKISFAATDGVVRTFAVWPDGISALVPEVDMLVLVRDALAHKRWFRRPSPATLLSGWSDALPLLSAYPRSEEPMTHFHIRHDYPPERVIEFFRRAWPIADKEHFTAIAPDMVLDGEYLA